VVIGALGSLAALAAASILCAPVPLALAVGLAALIVLIHLRALRSQCFGRAPTALRRLALTAEGDWLLEFGDGRRQRAPHRATSARLGGWLFLHWPGGWAVVTVHNVGEDPWRRLTARLREHGRSSHLRRGSLPRTFPAGSGRTARPEPTQPKVRKAPDGH
jgi:hypothetical protein